MDERDANYWTSLVPLSCEEPEVMELLDRHAVDLAHVKWIHGAGRVPLPKAGVIVYFWRPGAGADAEVFLHGVEFAVAGLRGGESYEGSLPMGIDASDTFMDISTKLNPAMPTPGNEPHSFEAVFPEHRLVIRMDADDMLQSLTWVSTRELRRG